MHETEAQLMQTTLSPSEPAADWTRLRPVIDDVIVALREEDREAIALRFFEKRSFVEVGIALRVTEEAARKRVDRALEKLRAMLEQRGITSTTAALGIALPACAVAHSPAGLGGTVARQALANASAKTLLGTIARTLWPAAAVLVVGSLVLVSQRRSNDALHTELMARVAGKSALETLRAENQQLTKSIASVPAPAPPRNDVAARILFTGGQEGRIRTARPNDTTVTFGPTITIDASRALVWNTDYINLDEFKRRLNELHDHNPKAIILIRSVSKRNGEAVKYAIEQARQAKIQTSLSEDALDVSWWF